MATPELTDTVPVSDTAPAAVRVGATAYFLPDESDPDDRKFLFGYTIVIANDSPEPVRLVSRRWLIIDGNGRREEVRGPGVVGQTPRIAPGESYQYQSYCPLKTPWGTMEGEYEMRRDDGSTFPVNIARFYLAVPKPDGR